MKLPAPLFISYHGYGDKGVQLRFKTAEDAQIFFTHVSALMAQDVDRINRLREKYDDWSSTASDLIKREESFQLEHYDNGKTE